MSFISDYLTDTVTWRKPGLPDFYGDVTYTDTSIKARWEGRRALVRDSSGSQVVSEARVFCTAPVASRDVLVASDGSEWPVIGVAPQKGLDGKLSHNEVSL